MNATNANSNHSQRNLALAAGFFAWMLAGLQIGSFQLLARPAVLSLSVETAGTADAERAVQQWMSWQQAAFLLGAAAGGWIFGSLGDRVGRVRALAASVFAYSLFAGLGFFATSADQLLTIRFLSCLGVGGAWPNAVALVAESWPDVSRPLLAGVLGMAANLGFVLLGAIGCLIWVTTENWRMVFLVAAAPAALGLAILAVVRDPPSWHARRGRSSAATGTLAEIFHPPYRRRTLLGIVLGAVPVLGTAVNVVWIVPWTDQVASHAAESAAKANFTTTSGDGSEKDRKAADAKLSWSERYHDPRAKSARAIISRSSGAAVGSLIGGLLASLLGRRTTYFFISLASLATSGYLFGFLSPDMASFGSANFVLGLVGVTYFGWLPLYLPELFPARIRATGTGVTFNSGRAVAAVASVALAGVIQSSPTLDYASIGLWTSGVYAIGLVAILFAPDTSGKKLSDEAAAP